MLTRSEELTDKTKVGTVTELRRACCCAYAPNAGTTNSEASTVLLNENSFFCVCFTVHWVVLESTAHFYLIFCFYDSNLPNVFFSVCVLNSIVLLEFMDISWCQTEYLKMCFSFAVLRLTRLVENNLFS